MFGLEWLEFISHLKSGWRRSECLVLITWINNLEFVFERLNWLNLVDLFLVTLVFFAILLLLRDTQAIVLLRGGLILIVLISLLTSLEVLPAFSWLVSSTLPALLLAIPVIFAPEIRRTLERLGRAGILFPRAPARREPKTQSRQSSALQPVWRTASMGR